MKHRNDLMLLRIAQADAYAMACEYVNRHEDEPEYIELLQFKRYIEHPTHKIKPGHYTDDTQMSIANVEVLLTEPVLTEEVFADAYLRCFKRDYRDGYSRNFQRILEDVNTVKELRSTLRADSIANGAAMRAVPVGVFRDPFKVMNVAEIQAKVTHNTCGGITSAQLVALMSHYAMHTDEPLSQVGNFLKTMIPDVTFYDKPWQGRVASGDQPNGKDIGMGMLTAHAVYHLITHETSLLDIMRRVIEWGGDTDSVAAIAWGIASARMTEDVPEFMYHCLEPGKLYGPDFLTKLGYELMRAFVR